MNRRKLGDAQIIPIDYDDRVAWLAFRKNGIGGSEVGAVMNMNSYSSPAEIFHRKIGLYQFPDLDNEPMFWGREHEANIADKWQYWWNDKYIENYKAKNKVRRCQRVIGYGVNDKYPWLFGSLDRFINKGQMTLDEQVLKKGGVLEIKTISHWEADKWKHGVPESYVLQIHAYMLIYGFDYAEICILKTGNKMSVLPIHYSGIIGQRVIDETNYFWHKRVVPAQKLVALYRNAQEEDNRKLQEELLAEIDALEPTPDGSKSFREILNIKYRDRYFGEYTPGTDEMRDMATKYKVVLEMIKAFEQQKEKYRNSMVKEHIKHGSEYIRFGVDEGFTRVYKKANSDNATFDNKITLDVDTNAIEELAEKMLSVSDKLVKPLLYEKR